MADISPRRTSSSGSLRAEAPEWAPTGEAPRPLDSPGPRPIRTDRRRGDPLSALDAIPFTPSQGVCTPSPTNMAAMWQSWGHPFFSQPAWGMAGGYAGSPGPSSNGSDASLMHTSQPGTPGGAMWSGFCQPLPYSSTALQIVAASGALGSDPSTPVRGLPGSAGRSGGAAAAGGSFMMLPGSPMMAVSPGQMMFAQYFGVDAASKQSHSPPESHNSNCGSGDEGDGSDNASSRSGSGSLEVSEAARQIASAMCAAQQLPGEPPQQLLELASLLHAYGLVSAVPTFLPAPAAPLSPDSRRQAARQRQKSAPKLNPDGSVRLNARQRRTLRRAQERAMKALLEAQTKAHGISSEQAAAHLANMGVTSMLLGSPPAAAPMMHGSPVGHLAPPSPFMAAQVLASPGPMLAPQPDFGLGMGMMHGMQQAAAAAAMMQQAGGYDGGYGLPAGDMPMAMPMHATPPRFGGAAFGSPMPRYRGGSTPGNRMSRFAQESGMQGAVAAF